jgi:acetyl esterase/lipase
LTSQKRSADNRNEFLRGYGLTFVPRRNGFSLIQVINNTFLRVKICRIFFVNWVLVENLTSLIDMKNETSLTNYTVENQTTILPTRQSPGAKPMHKLIHCLTLALLSFYATSNAFAETATEEKLIPLLDAVTTMQQPADYRLSYGPGVFHFGDLRLPTTEGPHPVVVLIHGGCWTAKYGLHLMDAMAERLTELGFATWNPEFRRVGMKDGEWQDIFKDVVMATHYVDNLASRFNLDTNNVILTGHSSGGHLVLWLAHQEELINKQNTMKVKAVVSLAPLTDLAEVAGDDTLPCHKTVEGLMGGSVKMYPQRYKQASPIHMSNTGLELIIVNGKQDSPGFYRQFLDYRKNMAKRGHEIRHLEVGPSGHFEMITPSSAAWKDVEKAFLSLK